MLHDFQFVYVLFGIASILRSTASMRKVQGDTRAQSGVLRYLHCTFRVERELLKEFGKYTFIYMLWLKNNFLCILQHPLVQCALTLSEGFVE